MDTEQWIKIAFVFLLGNFVLALIIMSNNLNNWQGKAIMVSMALGFIIDYFGTKAKNKDKE